MNARARPLLAALLALLFLSACRGGATADAAGLPPRYGDTVIWLSVDGVRPDYLDRGATPWFDEAFKTSAHSRQLRPVFPSVTFASHVSQATGTTPGSHGIVGNSFYDRATGETYSYPGPQRLLDDEPIWTTATRQGLRVMVYDWTLSHAQEGPHATAYHGQRFDPSLSNRDRLWQLIEGWRADEARNPAQPLRLLMGYAVGPDSPGHRHGPDAREPVAAFERMDGLLARFERAALEIFSSRPRHPADRLWLIVSSDHGMSPVTTLVHPQRLLRIGRNEPLPVVTTANVAHVFVPEDDPIAKEDRLKRLEAALRGVPFARAYRAEQLPARWGYRHPTRTGDLVVVLGPGHVFTTRIRDTTMDAREAGQLLGAHGFDPAEDPNMDTILLIRRLPTPQGSRDLGPVDGLHLHATVAGLLGIQPAPKAAKPPRPILPRD